ncbi:hypothetical protein C8Z91_03135, partial [Paenibacillus elgii]
EHFLENLNFFNDEFKEELKNLQQFVDTTYGITPAWASSCLNRYFGLIDGVIEIVKLVPIAKKPCVIDLDPVVALGKISYSFMNIVSLLHDILDNVGFAIGVLYYSRSTDVSSKSFNQLFSKEGKIENELIPNHINELLIDVYEKGKHIVDKDNESKHKFFSGVGEIYVQKELIETTFENFSGNLLDLMNYNMISIDECLKITKHIKDQLLLVTIRLVNLVSRELSENQIK